MPEELWITFGSFGIVLLMGAVAVCFLRPGKEPRPVLRRGQPNWHADPTERRAIRDANVRGLRTFLTGSPYGRVGRRRRR